MIQVGTTVRVYTNTCSNRWYYCVYINIMTIEKKPHNNNNNILHLYIVVRARKIKKYCMHRYIHVTARVCVIGAQYTIGIYYYCTTSRRSILLYIMDTATYNVVGTYLYVIWKIFDSEIVKSSRYN